MIGKVSQIDQLGELLRQSEKTHSVISANIANVNTPNYKSLDVRFDQLLSQARNELGLEANPEYFEIDGLLERQDGNNVDIDHELVKLTKNSMNYQTIAQLITSKMGMYRSAINGRS